MTTENNPVLDRTDPSTGAVGLPTNTVKSDKTALPVKQRSLKVDARRALQGGSDAASKAAPGASLPVKSTLNSYDFVAEKQALQHLLNDDPDFAVDPLDPLYARYELYLTNVSALEQSQSEREERAQANAEVPTSEARKARSIGALRSEDEDYMSLHTMEAMRLYLGVSADTADAKAAATSGPTSKFGVPGARRAATALRQLFLLSAHDNPYADWKLVQTDERVEVIKKLIDKTTTSQLKKLEDMRVKGLNYSILGAKVPQKVSLGYRSPYGYMMSTVIVNFDYAVRVLKSAERRDLITKSEVYASLYKIKHEMRSMFEAAMQGQRVLMSNSMLGLKRADYLPQSANSEAGKRMEAAKQIFGVVPQDIFMGGRLPRHSLRNERISTKELAVLKAVVQGQQDAEKAAATSAPGAKLGQSESNLID